MKIKSLNEAKPSGMQKRGKALRLGGGPGGHSPRSVCGVQGRIVKTERTAPYKAKSPHQLWTEWCEK